MYKRLGELIGFRFNIAKEIQSFPITTDSEVLLNTYEFLAEYIKVLDSTIKEHKSSFIGEGYYKDF